MNNVYRIDLDLLNQKKYLLEMVLDKKIKHKVEVKNKDGNITYADLISEDNEVKLLSVYTKVIDISDVYSATITLFFEFQQSPALGLTYIQHEKIFTTKYSDFETGTYLVVYVNLSTLDIQFDILVKHQKICTIAGCFSFDVEDHYKVVSYKKIQ